MEVAGGAGDLDFGVHQAAGGGRHRGHVLLRERSVEQHHGVRAQAVAFGLEKGGEDDAAALLLTLDRHPQVDGQSAAFRLHRVADGGDQRHVVRLAVAGAARVDLAIADGRLERRRLPLLERVRGLDVVVAVDEERGRPLGSGPLGVDGRVTVAFHQPGFHPRVLEPLPHELGAAAAVRLVSAQRAHARDPQLLEVIGLGSLLSFPGKVDRGLSAHRSQVTSVAWAPECRHDRCGLAGPDQAGAGIAAGTGCGSRSSRA